MLHRGALPIRRGGELRVRTNIAIQPILINEIKIFDEFITGRNILDEKIDLVRIPDPPDVTPACCRSTCCRQAGRGALPIRRGGELRVRTNIAIQPILINELKILEDFKRIVCLMKKLNR
jgi:hypothetical protein